MTQIQGSLREQVRDRAQRRCEYCHEPEHVSLYGFHVDHIIAQKHHGSDDPDNLAWACPACNITKGTDIASYDWVTGALVPYFNPRKDDWEEHFVLDDEIILGKTPIGRATARMLEFNHPEKIETRRGLISAGLW